MKFSFTNRPELTQQPKNGYGFVYKYVFSDGRIYIGQTTHSVKERHSSHKSGCITVDKIIRDHDSKNKPYRLELLGEYPICGENNLNDMEIKYINEFHSIYPYGYNMTSGGQQRFELSDISKQKKHESTTGEKHWCFGENQIFCPQTNKMYDTLTQASLELNLRISHISEVARGMRDNVLGFVFYYIDDGKYTMALFNRIARAVSKYYVKIETDEKYYEQRKKSCYALSQQNKGKKYSKEHCRHISQGLIGRKLSPEHIQKIKDRMPPFVGKTHTPETRKKLSTSKLGDKNPMYGQYGKNAPNSKEVVAYKYPSMEEIGRFESQSQAGEVFGLDFQIISYHCIHHTIHKKSMIGFRFADDVEFKPETKIYIVGKYTLDGEHIGTYVSYADAAKSVGVTSRSIILCCTGKTKQCKGFVWKRLN